VVTGDPRRSRRPIAPDLPGQGASEVSDGRLGADRVVTWLGELIEHTCLAHPVVVGQLVGGAIAVRFVADHPDRVDRLVLVVPLGLAPFAPSPEFGAAITGFIARPSAETHDELRRRCVYDLDERQRIGATWEPLRPTTWIGHAAGACPPACRRCWTPSVCPRSHPMSWLACPSRPRCSGGAMTPSCHCRSPRPRVNGTGGRCTSSSRPETSPPSKRRERSCVRTTPRWSNGVRS